MVILSLDEPVGGWVSDKEKKEARGGLDPHRVTITQAPKTHIRLHACLSSPASKAQFHSAFEKFLLVRRQGEPLPQNSAGSWNNMHSGCVVDLINLPENTSIAFSLI